MYPSLIPGKKIPCPMFGGRGEHTLCLDYDTGELFVRCVHLRQKTNRKADKIVVSAGQRITSLEDQILYEEWRDEIFFQAAKYGN
mgnify:CR=1 FL=1